MTDIEGAARAFLESARKRAERHPNPSAQTMPSSVLYEDLQAAFSAVLSEPSEEMVVAAMDAWMRRGGILSASSSTQERLAMRAALVAVGKLFAGRTG